MNYDLAKELKEAGFPQKDGKYTSKSLSSFSERLRTKSFSGKQSRPAQFAYIPNLEELIEACGKGLAKIEHMGEGWIASGGKYSYDGKEGHWEFYKAFMTPTEAVARLWLALNKKV